MTDSNVNSPVHTGEQRLSKRKRSFWIFCGLGMLGAVFFGLLTGIGRDMVLQGDLPAWAIIPVVAIAVAAFIAFSISYFRRVDEVDFANNAWAGLIALYFYAITFPIWLLLNQFGIAPEPNHFIIYIATMLVTFAAYGARRLGLI